MNKILLRLSLYRFSHLSQSRELPIILCRPIFSYSRALPVNIHAPYPEAIRRDVVMSQRRRDTQHLLLPDPKLLVQLPQGVLEIRRVGFVRPDVLCGVHRVERERMGRVGALEYRARTAEGRVVDVGEHGEFVVL